MYWLADLLNVLHAIPSLFEVILENVLRLADRLIDFVDDFRKLVDAAALIGDSSNYPRSKGKSTRRWWRARKSSLTLHRRLLPLTFWARARHIVLIPLIPSTSLIHFCILIIIIIMEIEQNIPKIRVCIRKRPLMKKELANNEKDIIEVRGSDEVFVRELKWVYEAEIRLDKVHRRALFQVRLGLRRRPKQLGHIQWRRQTDSRVRPQGRQGILLRLRADRWANQAVVRRTRWSAIQKTRDFIYWRHLIFLHICNKTAKTAFL